MAYGTKYGVLVRSPDAAALQVCTCYHHLHTTYWLANLPHVAVLALQVHMKAPTSAATANMLLSPMPGTLLSLAVAVGAKVSVLVSRCSECSSAVGAVGALADETPRPHPHPVMLQVHAGQDLCVVEAMKMQNVLTAPRDGVVKELLASAGATLSADQAILSFEDATKAARA